MSALQNMQPEHISDVILAAALKQDTLAGGLNLIYDLVIAWVEKLAVDALFLFAESRLDQGRTPAGIALVPSRAYLEKWPEKQLREQPVFALNERLLTNDLQPDHHMPAAGIPADLTQEEMTAFSQILAERLSIEQGLDLVERLVNRFAALYSRAILLKEAEQAQVDVSAWDEQKAFNFVYTTLYFHIIDTVNAHGLWHSLPELKEVQYSAPPPRQVAAPAPLLVDVREVAQRRLDPASQKAYQLAAFAFIHYRLEHGSGRIEGMPYRWHGEPDTKPLKDFEFLDLEGDLTGWAQPLPGRASSLRATCFLILAGTAALSLVLEVLADPLQDHSAMGQAVMKMMGEDSDAFDLDYDESQNLIAIQILYEKAYQFIHDNWKTVAQLAQKLLKEGRMEKGEVYGELSAWTAR